MQDQPLVSVIIAVLNGAELLPRAVESALSQTEQNLEVVIVDDGSTDGTWATIQDLSRNLRVRGFRNAYPTGANNARNKAIAEARGEWIAILDHDDMFEKQRLERLVGVAIGSGCDFVVDNQYLFDAKSQEIFDTAIPVGEADSELDISTLISHSMTGSGTFDYGIFKPVIRASLLAQSGIRYRENCPNGHDFFFLLDLLVADAKAVIVLEPMYCYSVPFGPISRQPAYSGKKLYNYQKMLEVNDEVISQLSAKLDPKALALLRQRSESILAYGDYLCGKHGLAHWTRDSAALLKPHTWRFLRAAAIRNFQRKLGRVRLGRF